MVINLNKPRLLNENGVFILKALRLKNSRGFFLEVSTFGKREDLK